MLISTLSSLYLDSSGKITNVLPCYQYNSSSTFMKTARFLSLFVTSDILYFVAISPNKSNELSSLTAELRFDRTNKGFKNYLR